MKEPYLYESLTVSSLEKVMPACARPGHRYTRASMLKNERFHYQIAIKGSFDDKTIVSLEVESPLAGEIKLFEVGLVPCELTKLPLNDPRDSNFISDAPGLFPDILEPINPVGLSLTSKQWKSVWVTVSGDEGAGLSAGIYPIVVTFKENGEAVAQSRFELTVLDAELPEQKLINTNWFHLDSLMSYYGVEAFSEEHWELIEKFLRCAVKNGMNMALTPVHTPPLDTAVGGERLTVQLADIRCDGGKWTFEFPLLTRYVELCRKCGIMYFEIAHLFTQWGARFAPKIMATVDGEYKRVFGWDTSATSEEYADFLKEYLPALTGYFKAAGLADRVYFHLSDEPNMDHMESYKAASELVSGLLEGYHTFDALSDYSFYQEGLVKVPIPGTYSVDEFKENGVSPLWCYYCAFGSDFLTMRYFSAPSARNRIFGTQLYKYDIAGFLHWGYNFYFAQFSLYPVDPYRNTDSGGWCPSGDNYMVYPGKDGPISSIRQEVFFDALQDMRALSALEEKLSREAVIRLIDKDLFKPLSMYDYPKDDDYLLSLREQVNKLLAK